MVSACVLCALSDPLPPPCLVNPTRDPCQLSCPINFNLPSKARAGRVAGRCHAALGQLSLSAAALDAALELARGGEHILSEALAVRARARVGELTRAAAGDRGDSSSVQWSAAEARRRMEEVMGRMQGDQALHERLFR